MNRHNSIFASLKEKWPSQLVAREKVSEFSGGVLHPRSIANADAQGTGPRGRIRVGRKVVYPVTELIEWMESKSIKMD